MPSARGGGSTSSSANSRPKGWRGGHALVSRSGCFGPEACSSNLRDVFNDIATMKTEDDGVAFDASSLEVGPIRENQEYGGVRVTLVELNSRALMLTLQMIEINRPCVSRQKLRVGSFLEKGSGSRPVKERNPDLNLRQVAGAPSRSYLRPTRTSSGCRRRARWPNECRRAPAVVQNRQDYHGKVLIGRVIVSHRCRLRVQDVHSL